MLNHLEGEFNRIGKPGMAKIAAGMLEELNEQGISDIPFTSFVIQDLVNNPTVSQSDLPPFVFNKQKDIPESLYEIDALTITSRTGNALVRSHKTKIRDIYDASDKELLHDVRSLGRICLADLRCGLAAFKDRIIDERQKQKIEGNAPAILPYPSKSISYAVENTYKRG